MTYLQRAAILTELVRRLRERDSWAGATHVQKAAYLLQEMLGVPLGLRFRLYKFGPFSDSLRDVLDEMEVDGFIDVEPQQPPYGPRLQSANTGQLLARFGDEVRRYDTQLDFIVDKLARLGVADLEKVSTAFYVTVDEGSTDVALRASRLHEIKPHVALDAAEEAIRRVDAIVAEAPRA